MILTCSFVATTLTLALIHERVPDRDVVPLSDVFLDTVSEADWALDVSEILIMIATTATSFVLVFHKHRQVQAILSLISIWHFVLISHIYILFIPRKFIHLRTTLLDVQCSL